jgi:hypothetical protein
MLQFIVVPGKAPPIFLIFQASMLHRKLLLVSVEVEKILPAMQQQNASVITIWYILILQQQIASCLEMTTNKQQVLVHHFLAKKR